MASSAALVQRALALLGEGEAGQARQLLEQAAALDPRDPVPRHNLAELSFRQGRFDQAQRLFEGVLAEHPGFLPAYPSPLALLEQRRASDPAPA
ncbi:MAG: tetratricopeptide repeat protein [Cyanobium sp.]